MKPALPTELLPFMWHFLKEYKPFVFTFTCLALVTGLGAPISNILIKDVIDALGASHSGKIASLILWPAVLFVLNFEIHNLCWRGMGYLNYKFEPVIKNRIISETFEYVQGQAYHFFQTNLAGQISSQINALADNLERIIHELSRNILRTVSLLIVAFISMYFVHPDFFYASLAWFLALTALSLRKSRKFIDLSESYAAAESRVSGQLVDSITNASSIRIFTGRFYERSYLAKALSRAKNAFQEKELFALRLHLIQGLSLTVMIALMLYFLIFLRMKHRVTVGDFALILGLAVEVGYMTWWALALVDELNKALGKCKQSLVNLFVPWEIRDKEGAMSLRITRGRITFSKVQFSYQGTSPFFENKSVTIDGGQKVGLVGYSGSGKSTFVNLILRLYDVNSGSICIDGQDIRGCTQESLRSSIAMIPQDPSLFHRSLMENIRYGRVGATNEEVIQAAKRAGAHDFITHLSQGYETLVGERGIKLSGGQRQRIAIARAILKAAPILILDEATSQLDSLTENEIQDSLEELTRGKTTIVIAHRLSTLLHMDRILVFDRGKIIEDGSHEVLLAQGGMYGTLWNTQVGGFLPEQKA